jgi:hypothetical protein
MNRLLKSVVASVTLFPVSPATADQTRWWLPTLSSRGGRKVCTDREKFLGLLPGDVNSMLSEGA